MDYPTGRLGLGEPPEGRTVSGEGGHCMAPTVWDHNDSQPAKRKAQGFRRQGRDGFPAKLAGSRIFQKKKEFVMGQGTKRSEGVSSKFSWSGRGVETVSQSRLDDTQIQVQQCQNKGIKSHLASINKNAAHN